MSSSSLRSLRIFEALCGEACFGDVTIVTTMWDMLRSQEALQSAEKREATLQNRDDFLGRLIQGGARYARHQDTRTSSIEIVEKLVNRNRGVTLAVQEELERDSVTTLVDTTVGRYLEGDLRDMRKRYETKIAQLQAFNDDSGEKDDGLLSVVQTEKEIMLRIESDIDFLHLTFETLRNERGIKMMEGGRIAANEAGETAATNDELIDGSMMQNNDQPFLLAYEPTEAENHSTRVQYAQYDAKVMNREKRNKPKKPSAWEDVLRATIIPSYDPGKAMVHQARRSRSEDRVSGSDYPKKDSQYRSRRAHSKVEEARSLAHAMVYQGQMMVEPDRADQTILEESEYHQNFDNETWPGPQHMMVYSDTISSSPEAYKLPNGSQRGISWDQSGLKRIYPTNSGINNTHLLQYRP